MTTAAYIIETCRQRGIELKVDGDKLRFRGVSVDDSVRLMLRKHKLELLALLAPKPKGCAWREDKYGRLWFSDGTVYAPFKDGRGWILVRHPSRRLLEPGTIEAEPDVDPKGQAFYLPIDKLREPG